jgi:hypothetical protein
MRHAADALLVVYLCTTMAPRVHSMRLRPTCKRSHQRHGLPVYIDRHSHSSYMGRLQVQCLHKIGHIKLRMAVRVWNSTDHTGCVCGLHSSAGEGKQARQAVGQLVPSRVQDALLAPSKGLVQSSHAQEGDARLYHRRPHVTCMDSITLILPFFHAALLGPKEA